LGGFEISPNFINIFNWHDVYFVYDDRRNEIMKFKELFEQEENLNEELNLLLETLITFGGKAYPKFGNIVILAGGAGSGKGFIKDNLVGLEGMVFDVDHLKLMAGKSEKIRKKVMDEFGVDIAEISKNLRDPKNVSKLHEIIGDILRIGFVS
jgi:hypothetical protein